MLARATASKQKLTWESETMRTRGFERVAERARTVTDAQLQKSGIEFILPHRATKQSAGYDFHALKTISIGPLMTEKFNTDVKAYMMPDEVLHLYPRSSIGIKRGLMLANTIPTIDADYYENPDNDGEITIYLRNVTQGVVTIEAGERIAQGIFEKYLVADNDPDNLPDRLGGVGHTGRR